MAELSLQTVSKAVCTTDSLWLVAGIFCAATLRFGSQLQAIEPAKGSLFDMGLSPFAQAGLMLAIWVFALLGTKTSDPRILGVGPEEYRRIAVSGISVPVVLAFAALVVKIDVSRAFVGYSVVLGTAFMLLNHWLWRQWLSRQRGRGFMVTRVALIASNSRIEALAEHFAKEATHGLRLGMLVLNKATDAPAALDRFGVPITDLSDTLVSELSLSGCNLVYVSGSHQLTENFIKRFSWQLEGSNINLAVGSSLIDVSAGRLQTVQLAGSPTFLVDVARFTGWRYFVKRTIDVVGGLIASILTLPIVLTFGLLIWLEDHGPMIFAQERVGLNGETFKMYKLRSMRVGAERDHEKLAATNTSPNAVMYKNENDTRITRVGHFIRRWSIDELPQFWNAVLGNMSIVGPRPPLPAEVMAYANHVHRRHLVKPGITGLWQVSGRNKLSWEDTVRLDLDYVENWSVIGDMLLVMKTAKSVLVGRV